MPNAAGDLYDQIVIGTDGDDVLSGGTGRDLIRGLPGNDRLFGYDGNDELWGEEGSDEMHGGSGDDFFSAASSGGDHDLLFGEDGDDSFLIDWTDQVQGGTGRDRVHISFAEEYGPSYFDGPVALDMGNLRHGLALPGGGFIQDVEVLGSLRLGAYDDDVIIGTQDEQVLVYGGYGNDVLRGQGSSIAAYGGNGNDKILGSTADDYIEGNVGADFLAGGGGNDVLVAASGNNRWFDPDVDHLDGGAGDDVLSVSLGDVAEGGEGRDTILIDYYQSPTAIVGDTATLIHGGSLTDNDPHMSSIELFGGFSLTDKHDTLIIGTQSDPALSYTKVSAAYGDDTIIGQQSAVDVDGGHGKDLLVGSTAGDRLFGGYDTLTDVVLGGDGDDWIWGATGDRLFGGSGADVFYFANLEAGSTIEDFESGVDRIDLRDIVPEYEDWKLTFIGTGPATGALGEVSIVTDASETFLKIVGVAGMINLGTAHIVEADLLL